MNSLEKLIPELASGAVKQAYAKALAAGSSVLEVIDGQLVETHPDGSQRVVKALAPAVTVKPGSRRKVHH